MSFKVVFWLFFTAALLGGCAGNPPQEAQPTTERESLDRSAGLAFAQGQYAQAATLYEAALDEALAEDLPNVIIDARFNLALVKTYLGAYAEALAQLDQADAERIRRKLGADPELDLLRATIRYRAGDPAKAQAILARLLKDTSLTPAAAAKARFVAGLVAADRLDANLLRTHLDSIPPDAGLASQADRLELQARLLALGHDRDGALALLDQAAAMRSLDRDYRGMVRALATAGAVAEQAGQLRQAADYLLRAGRSAAQRNGPEAHGWLERARDLGQRGGSPAVVLEASTMLEVIGNRE